ncbi:Hypothetical_protein [Hexamita inflata]|uniref:Hypothetical_protein n=1 Tax=Hexamita inflata TaxID=28002 RepID=A0ABP1HI35_9EUKA
MIEYGQIIWFSDDCNKSIQQLTQLFHENQYTLDSFQKQMLPHLTQFSKYSKLFLADALSQSFNQLFLLKDYLRLLHIVLKNCVLINIFLQQDEQFINIIVQLLYKIVTAMQYNSFVEELGFHCLKIIYLTQEDNYINLPCEQIVGSLSQIDYRNSTSEYTTQYLGSFFQINTDIKYQLDLFSVLCYNASTDAYTDFKSIYPSKFQQVSVDFLLRFSTFLRENISYSYEIPADFFVSEGELMNFFQFGVDNAICELSIECIRILTNDCVDVAHLYQHFQKALIKSGFHKVTFFFGDEEQGSVGIVQPLLKGETDLLEMFCIQVGLKHVCRDEIQSLFEIMRRCFKNPFVYLFIFEFLLQNNYEFRDIDKTIENIKAMNLNEEQQEMHDEIMQKYFQ